MPASAPTKRRALTIVERGDREFRRLIDELPSRALTRTGIGGGAWSPADLIGHLAAWEEFALVAAVRAVPADRWAKPPFTRGRPLGVRVGSILGGPGGAFRHVDAHLPDLRAFVATHAPSS